MQLIPETAERFDVLDVWDPKQNLRGGMAYLRWLLENFNGDVKLALAGYNAGEASVLRYGGIPPYYPVSTILAGQRQLAWPVRSRYSSGAKPPVF